jgi:NAD(P)H-flavin reductase/ferredoxin
MSTLLTFDENAINCQPNETVLDALSRAGMEIPNGCGQGVCQTCLMRCTDKSPPVLAQAGLKASLQNQNYFLACICHPEQDMTIALPEAYEQDLLFDARVVHKELLTTDIMRLVLKSHPDLSFYAGQSVNLARADGLKRCYSIANRPNASNHLEFHIRKLANGRFTTWAHEELSIGDSLQHSDARGDSYYLPDFKQQPLLLIGTGTGLAPLWGIINEALYSGHQGEIHLYHGSRESHGLYLVNELHALSDRFDNFHYTPCVSGQTLVNGYSKGRANEIALARHENLKGWRIYLCGHPEMTKHGKTQAYIKGASLADIYVDAFNVAGGA